MTCTLSEDESESPESKDIANKAFGDKLHGMFEATLEMVKATADEMGVERTVAWITGEKHIRQCIAFPRMMDKVYI